MSERAEYTVDNPQGREDQRDRAVLLQGDFLAALAGIDAHAIGAPSLVRALRGLAEIGAWAAVPVLDPSAGQDAARRLEALREPALRRYAPAVSPDDIRGGLSAAAAIARSFGRSWDDLLRHIGEDLILDRIGNVLLLASAIEVADLRSRSLERGQPHRRSVARVVNGEV